MSIELLSLLVFGLLIFFLVIGLPLVFALGGTAVFATYFLWGPDALHMMANRTFTSANAFVFLAIPMFIFMGNMLEASGIAGALYRMMYKWMGGLRGGLAIGTVGICAVFAAMVGVSGASTVSMALVALPSMLAHRYDEKLSIGCLAAGGALGVLIPPSVMLIILGMYTNTSIGMLYAGAVIPGFMLAFLFMAYIAILCAFFPHLAPALPKEVRVGWGEKIKALKDLILPILLIVFVLTSIFSGAATPSEAAAVGALGSIGCALFFRKLNWPVLKKCCEETLKLNCMVMWIIFGASVFTALYTAIGAQGLAKDLLSYLPGGRWGQMLGMMAILVFLGCFLDPTGIIMISTPIFFPIARSLGFDPVWFGVLYAINMEMGFLTPPFGFNLFYMQSVAPPHVTMVDIYKSIIPFVLIEMGGLGLCMIFPEIILWLPRVLLQ